MKIIVVDAETNGLFGAPFAVGAVLFETESRSVLSTFSGRGPLVGEPVDFVRINVVGAVASLPEYKSNAQLRVAFWQWFSANKNDCKIFADVGYPVEALWFRLCQEDMGAEWGGPYPLHDVATLFLAAGLDDNLDRAEFVKGAYDTTTAHNPMSDAMVSAYSVALLFDQLRLVTPNASATGAEE